MALQPIIPSLRRYLTLSKYFGCSYFEWDEETGRIRLRQRDHHSSVHKWILIHTGYVILQAIAVIMAAEGHGLLQNLQSVMFSGLYLFTLAFRFEFDPDYVPMQINNWSLFDRISGKYLNVCMCPQNDALILQYIILLEICIHKKFLIRSTQRNFCNPLQNIFHRTRNQHVADLCRSDAARVL